MRDFLKWIPLASGFLVLVFSLAVAVITVAGRNSANNLATTQNLATKATEEVATLALSPGSGDYTFSPTASYPVGIVVDSGGKSVDGVDVIVNFDPKKVMVVNTQVSTTTMFEQFPLNQVDNVRGQIRFSALTFSPKPVVGIVGTFQVRPLVKGEVTLSFDFTPGASTDSNVAEHGTAKDVLGSVTNATYTFK